MDIHGYPWVSMESTEILESMEILGPMEILESMVVYQGGQEGEAPQGAFK